MESFCTVEQYVERFGEVSDRGIAQACLDDATAAIAALLDRRGVDYADADEAYKDRLMRVCRSMANRIMPSPSLPGGATHVSMSAGPYSEGYTLASPYGTPKPLPSELELLGIGGNALRTLNPSIDGYYGSSRGEDARQ